jgi:hypothetical protein
MNVSLSDKFQAAQHETKLYKQENSKYWSRVISTGFTFFLFLFPNYIISIQT